MTVELDAEGRRLLDYLVKRLPEVDCSGLRNFVTYKGVHDALGLPHHGSTYGESLKIQGLNNLAAWTHESGFPGITGIIIDSNTKTPGNGYFELFGRKPEDYTWWLDEISLAKKFDWSQCLNVPKDLADSETDWSDAELRASVEAYFEMMGLQCSSKAYIKKRYYEALSTKFGRTPSAFEFRMQNISYVLALMGRSWLPGLRPARNVGSNVAMKLELLIAAAEKIPCESVVGFEIAVRGRRRGLVKTPIGITTPIRVQVQAVQFQRDPAVKAWVLEQANGVCESCGQPSPFNDVDDLPFLEVHHVRSLAENGSDSVTNAVGLCPNCHRAMHYSIRANELREDLYKGIARLIRE